MLRWSTGLFDCLDDCGICCYGWCCTPCLYGENAEKIDGSSCCGQCCVYYLFTGSGLCCHTHMSKRETLRLRYGLEEDCNDCLATTFCATCAICQEARELKFRQSSFGAPRAIVAQPMCEDVYSLVQPTSAYIHLPMQIMQTVYEPSSMLEY